MFVGVGVVGIEDDDPGIAGRLESRNRSSAHRREHSHERRGDLLFRKNFHIVVIAGMLAVDGREWTLTSEAGQPCNPASYSAAGVTWA